MIFLGLDLSLNASGVAFIDTDARTYAAHTLKTPARVIKAGAHPRIAWVKEGVLSRINALERPPSIAVVEGPAYGANGSAVHQLAGMWWHITHDLWTLGIPYVSVSPGSCKLYASGNGAADKDIMVLATARAFLDFQGDNNAADALWFAHMAADQYGHPLVEVAGKKRRDTLLGTKKNPLQWPGLGDAP